MSARVLYPFTAIVGQERMKEALLLTAVHPALGGVLIRGEKGSAKSTAVRALTGLLPEVEVVVGCQFNDDPTEADPCDDCTGRRMIGPLIDRVRRRVPVVELPVSATVEGVIGSIDLERSAATGRRALRPGLLARAHRGILYVDEVNLLNDQLADVLLDAAAMGQNHVERDGISISHPARFMLIGTMNPEEGNLRPQLLDRFGLIVDAESLTNPADRTEVIRRRTAFEFDPEAFVEAWRPTDHALRDRVERARLRVPNVAVSDATVELIATVCARFHVDGMRADLAMFRAAVARAALDGRSEVIAEDVRAAAYLALPHRRTSHVTLQLEEDIRHLDGVVESLLGPAPAHANGARPLDSLTLAAPR